MSEPLCSKCPHHYVGKGWYCWSGNKKSVPHCNNGNPDKDRILYNSKGERKDGDNNVKQNKPAAD